MLNKRPNKDIILKFKKFSTLYDKLFILIAGSLWIISTLWDIYKLQRYWLDYTVEFYGCFFIFYMMVFSINPKLLPVKIYNSFSLITTVNGRGTLLVLISILFLRDKHGLHQFCAILLFIGGILYFLIEFLVPTTKEELEEIKSIYINKNNNINKNIKDVSIDNSKNSLYFDTNKSIIINQKSNEILNNIQNEITNNNININNNNLVEEEEVKKEQDENKNKEENENKDNIDNNNNLVDEVDENQQNETKKKEEIENKDNNNNSFLVGEEIVRKTDNPYEIPDDF